MFLITGNKGFHITFANGHKISVQWGPGNYCDNYNLGFKTDGSAVPASSQAEILAFGRNGEYLPTPLEDGTMQTDGDVQGYCEPDHVAAIIAYVASLPKE